MKRHVTFFLAAGSALPLLLLFWPFVLWGSGMQLLLRVMAALCAQALFCRLGTHPLIRSMPLVLTGALALWGMYLYCTSPAWAYATLGGLIADYVSPCLCCAAVYALFLLRYR